MLDPQVSGPAALPGIAERRSASASGSGEPLRIGLLNNMPDSAFAQTERQFRRLIGPRAEVNLFAFDAALRGNAGASARQGYQSHRAIPAAGLDALVITGCEPKAPRLDEEPYFAAFAEIVDWARAGTVSTLFSCLAAHAAVLHRDGIARRPLGAKLSGVFPCRAAGPHPLLAGLPTVGATPHSRFNGLDEAELRAHGYSVLRRSDAVGADLFVREEGSLFVFLQGHPEYDADSLAREYRRDVGRFLDGSREHYPALPQNYFPPRSERLFAAFRERAQRERGTSLMAAFPSFDDAPVPPPAWRDAALGLFRNWLALVARRRVGAPPASGLPLRDIA